MKTLKSELYTYMCDKYILEQENMIKESFKCD